jgi:hypothetical protein
MMTRRILSQGELDGACFVYALANACLALTGRRPNLAAASQAMSRLTWPGDLLDPAGGTTRRYGGSPGDLDRDADMFVRCLSDGRAIARRIPGPVDFPGVRMFTGSRAVVVLRYQGDSFFQDGMDHWACAVGAESGRILLACSNRLSRCALDFDYGEGSAPEGRAWNDAISPGRARLVPGDFFQVSLVEGARLEAQEEKGPAGKEEAGGRGAGTGKEAVMTEGGGVPGLSLAQIERLARSWPRSSARRPRRQ